MSAVYTPPPHPTNPFPPCHRFIADFPIKRGDIVWGGGDCGLRDLMDLNPLILKSADCLWFASTGEHRGID